MRRLTQRLETLQRGVQRWGDGELSARVPVQGEDEVADLSARFNSAAERIEALMATQHQLLASQKSLLANASHELRSPLTRIRMGMELMGSQPGPAFREEISRNIAELDQLIDEILLASRLDAREADMGTVESIDLLGLAVEESARAGAGLELAEGVESLLVPGVAKLLRRLVRNLLENARRYGGAAGTAGIPVIVGREGGNAVLQVCDRGPGVPPAQRERIFEPFYRLPGASEREGGVGLGLALVKSIAERHGSPEYVHNGLDWEAYGPVDFERPRPYCHFLGKAAWRVKNVQGAIDVAGDAGVQLMVLGGTRLNIKRGFRFTWSRRVSFAGMVGGQVKLDLLQGSRGLVFPVLWHEPFGLAVIESCLLYTSPSPRDRTRSRMPSSA